MMKKNKLEHVSCEVGENLWRDKIQREVAIKKKNSFSQKKFINHIKICKKGFLVVFMGE